MHFPRILLTVVSAAVLFPSLLAQTASQPFVNLPRTMHMCGDKVCQTLIWNDGHYDGIFDGQMEVTSTFGVVRWDKKAVYFTGIISKPDQWGNYVTGIFTGNISPGGNGVDVGTDTWRAGAATGSLPFRLTWNPSDIADVDAARSQNRLPTFFRLCGGVCVGLTRNGGQYAGRDENTGAQVATYTVASLSPELAYMNLEMTGGQRGIVTGRVVGHTLIDGKLTWLNFFNGDTVRVRAAWGEDVASIEQGPIIRIPTQQTLDTGVQRQAGDTLGFFLLGLLLSGDDAGDNSSSHCRCGCMPSGAPKACVSSLYQAQQMGIIK